jgi:nicotinamide mononucleotide transporter
MSGLEIAANIVTATAIFLAGRNSVHTWWLGIIGCTLFGFLFYGAQLYADVTLQVFFVATSLIGWYQWAGGEDKPALPITRTHVPTLIISIIIGIIVGVIYALLLYHFTDAYAPGWDTVLLVGSVIGQILLMNRKIENWGFWLLVNTVAVPLFYSRGLYLTAGLYSAYWIHAIIAYRKWYRDYQAQTLAARG